MARKGYKVLYAREHYSSITEEITVSGVKIRKPEDSNNIVGYGLCFNADLDDLDNIKYAHTRIKSGIISEFYYFISIGKEEEIEKDLAGTVKEISFAFCRKYVKNYRRSAMQIEINEKIKQKAEEKDRKEKDSLKYPALCRQTGICPKCGEESLKYFGFFGIFRGYIYKCASCGCKC